VGSNGAAGMFTGAYTRLGGLSGPPSVSNAVELRGDYYRSSWRYTCLMPKGQRKLPKLGAKSLLQRTMLRKPPNQFGVVLQEDQRFSHIGIVLVSSPRSIQHEDLFTLRRYEGLHIKQSWRVVVCQFFACSRPEVRER
jgi:hypothetical protein